MKTFLFERARARKISPENMKRLAARKLSGVFCFGTQARARLSRIERYQRLNSL
ncbi:hypothetical protein RBWH47_03370 [Rhodopirellula baltica WH47]|uniref:Uncharacterized protein n=2 Tax=Rhodopirellula baltica TaxID=265606 RepID=F2APL4_RHOBT|nr:hypothetical protein RBWH47_03370 [Rhodopirellula baltica WH47]ELP32395.1 hypothetical protein RBSWK_03699 [Rhodopirellula baltica SWK14]